jgi:hypothetical protein
MNELCALGVKMKAATHQFLSRDRVGIGFHICHFCPRKSHLITHSEDIAMCQNQRVYVRKYRWESGIAEAGKPNVIVYPIVYIPVI